jgi:hypothetical protein
MSHLKAIMRSLRISLTAPPTLKHLKFSVTFLMRDEFRRPFFDEIRDADFWGDLNSFATHPASSRLQRVDIDIGSWANPPLC